MAYITLRDVSFTHELADTPTLKNLTLTLEKGKIYGLIGANGSGKTTLCNALRGFIPHYFPGDLTGEIILDGQPLKAYTSGELAQKVGYIFQNPFSQISGAKRTVFEEVAYGLENIGVERSEMFQRVREALKATHTEAYAFRDPFALSGGQQQRVAFASVLVMDTECLIIDEPTSQLDPASSEEVFAIIADLKAAGKTIILVEQKMDAIARLADELLVMRDGELLVQGAPKEVFSAEWLPELGVEWPEVVQLREACREAGLAVDPEAITPDQLDHSLSQLLEKEVGHA